MVSLLLIPIVIIWLLCNILAVLLIVIGTSIRSGPTIGGWWHTDGEYHFSLFLIIVTLCSFLGENIVQARANLVSILLGKRRAAAWGGFIIWWVGVGIYYFYFLRRLTAWGHAYCCAGLLGKGHLLLVWEVKAIYAGILDCAGAIFLYHLGEFDHILHRNWRLGEIHLGESVLETLLRKEHIECPGEAVAELDIVWEVKTIDERVLQYSHTELVSRKLVKFCAAKI